MKFFIYTLVLLALIGCSKANDAQPTARPGNDLVLNPNTKTVIDNFYSKTNLTCFIWAQETENASADVDIKLSPNATVSFDFKAKRTPEQQTATVVLADSAFQLKFTVKQVDLGDSNHPDNLQVLLTVENKFRYHTGGGTDGVSSSTISELDPNQEILRGSYSSGKSLAHLVSCHFETAR